jgi:hypothetical protein
MRQEGESRKLISTSRVEEPYFANHLTVREPLINFVTERLKLSGRHILRANGHFLTSLNS